MSIDAHLDLQKGDIKGESMNAGFEGQIQLLSWSWGVTNTGSFKHGSGGGGAKADFQDFHFTMQMCKASPLLFLACATGQHIKEAVLTARKAGQKDSQQTFLIIKFSDLLISNYQTGGTDESTGLPVEQVALDYSKIEIEYHAQDKAGKTSKASQAGYDLKIAKKA